MSAEPVGVKLQLLKPRLQVELQLPLEHAIDITLMSSQGRVQEPQCSGSVCRLTSQPSPGTALQFAQVPEQVRPQLPKTHVAVLFGPEGQTLPQLPQFCGLVWVLTHCPLQFTSGEMQLTTHCPLWHTLPLPQAVPHAPQLKLSVWVLTQALPHLVKPELQPKLQLLDAHTG